MTIYRKFKWITISLSVISLIALTSVQSFQIIYVKATGPPIHPFPEPGPLSEVLMHIFEHAAEPLSHLMGPLLDDIHEP